DPVLQIYNVQTGNADVIAKQLQEHYKDAKSVNIKNSGNNSIVALAPPDDQVDIAAFIVGPTNKGVKTVLIDCGAVEPAQVATMPRDGEPYRPGLRDERYDGPPRMDKVPEPPADRRPDTQSRRGDNPDPRTLVNTQFADPRDAREQPVEKPAKDKPIRITAFG